jgi:hypothetical protein
MNLPKLHIREIATFITKPPHKTSGIHYETVVWTIERIFRLWRCLCVQIMPSAKLNGRELLSSPFPESTWLRQAIRTTGLTINQMISFCSWFDCLWPEFNAVDTVIIYEAIHSGGNVRCEFETLISLCLPIIARWGNNSPKGTSYKHRTI